MKQFSVVVSALGNWYQTFKWYPLLKMIEIYLLFGGLGILILREIIFLVIPGKAYRFFSFIFYTFPLSSIAYHAFLLGAWLVLASRNVKYLPYALWGYALYYLFPFTGMSLSSLIAPIVYAVLGYGVFKYTVAADQLAKQ